MDNFELIPAKQAQQKAQAGTLLINGYDVEEKWQGTRVPSAISFMDYRQQAASLPKDTELMFYCA